MNTTELCFTPALELARRIKAKELSPVEVTEAVLGRIAALNPRLNAFCTLTEDAARKTARGVEKKILAGEDAGPLGGVPFSIKDLIITRGVRTMRGSKIYEHFVPEEDAPVVSRLHAAGGVMLGKTTTSEFGWKGVTDTVVTGITRNPWNLDCTPGGSSGGAGAQIAAGLGPLAIGTDGGGSIRIPAGFSGVFGIKPSFGRVPTYPASGHDQLSHPGPLTRTVADAALMLQVIAGPHESDRFSLEAPPAPYLARLHEGVKGLRVAWSPDLGYAKVHPEVRAIAERAARAFQELGCTVEEVDPGLGDPTDVFMVIYLLGVAGGLSPLLEQWETQMDPNLARVIREGRNVSAMQLSQAQLARHQLWDRTRRFFQTHDLLLTPTLAVPAFPVGQLTPDGKDASLRESFAWTPFTYPFNLTGNPAASLPAGFTSAGLPVGLQVVGRRFDDLTVLQACAAFEAAHPWAQKRPPL